MIKTMMIALLLSAPSLTLTHADPTPAITARYSQAYDDCIHHGERTGEMAMPGYVCNEREYAVQDARLNQAYKMVMTRLTEPRKAELRTLQRQWIGQRDMVCARREIAEGDVEGYVGVKLECLMNMTIARTIFLERYR
ncbi:lysozyme inhibitor LprI family protein [Sphingomonas sp. C3-2]|uniref:lysozyme inhibitor LprI family protein n=1 Tax=Sphingomonas sp. C3-2 TaxID=3062169 RepID=UPI00294AEAAC|nr:lysozyme inhibitor LprI family protein [Sphingomonas sp. C3-2]WOK37294.1 lysozyme inhibitor LprI family protein [Sphingomonas sp. C3-2]